MYIKKEAVLRLPYNHYLLLYSRILWYAHWRKEVKKFFNLCCILLLTACWESVAGIASTIKFTFIKSLKLLILAPPPVVIYPLVSRLYNFWFHNKKTGSITLIEPATSKFLPTELKLTIHQPKPLAEQYLLFS